MTLMKFEEDTFVSCCLLLCCLRHSSPGEWGWCTCTSSFAQVSETRETIGVFMNNVLT